MERILAVIRQELQANPPSSNTVNDILAPLSSSTTVPSSSSTTSSTELVDPTPFVAQLIKVRFDKIYNTALNI